MAQFEALLNLTIPDDIATERNKPNNLLDKICRYWYNALRNTRVFFKRKYLHYQFGEFSVTLKRNRTSTRCNRQKEEERHRGGRLRTSTSRKKPAVYRDRRRQTPFHSPTTHLAAAPKIFPRRFAYNFPLPAHTVPISQKSG